MDLLVFEICPTLFCSELDPFADLCSDLFSELDLVCGLGDFTGWRLLELHRGALRAQGALEVGREVEKELALSVSLLDYLRYVLLRCCVVLFVYMVLFAFV